MGCVRALEIQIQRKTGREWRESVTANCTLIGSRSTHSDGRRSARSVPTPRRAEKERRRSQGSHPELGLVRCEDGVHRASIVVSIYASIMPYMALQCFSCHVMQVKEVRKSSSSNSKWSCVLCNEKQSVRKVYSKADTAKEVRNFVQTFNLTRGQAVEAEGRARLEADALTEDLAGNHTYQEDEDGHLKETPGRVEYRAGQKSFKWDKFLPAKEEEVCPGDELQQPSDSMKFTTTLPEPPSRKRAKPRSSSPPPKRPVRDSTTSRNDAKPGSSILSDSTKPGTYASGPDYSFKFQQGSDSGSEDRAPLGTSTWECSTVSESKSSSLPDSGSDCSPKNVKSCHAQGSRIQTSKWSKYLT